MRQLREHREKKQIVGDKQKQRRKDETDGIFRDSKERMLLIFCSQIWEIE